MKMYDFTNRIATYNNYNMANLSDKQIIELLHDPSNSLISNHGLPEYIITREGYYYSLPHIINIATHYYRLRWVKDKWGVYKPKQPTKLYRNNAVEFIPGTCNIGYFNRYKIVGPKGGVKHCLAEGDGIHWVFDLNLLKKKLGTNITKNDCVNTIKWKD